MKWQTIVLVLIGIWVAFSPFVLGFADLDIPTWNNIFVGVIVVILSLWSYYLKHDNY